MWPPTHRNFYDTAKAFLPANFQEQWFEILMNRTMNNYKQIKKLKNYLPLNQLLSTAETLPRKLPYT